MIKAFIFRYFIIVVSIVFFLGISEETKAQYVVDYRIPDSTFIYTHSPNKATFYSAILPGLGQVYNKQYWKVPIIYAGFGGLIYYANYNNYVYNKYKDAYDIKLRIENGELGLEDEDKYPNNPSTQIRGWKDSWHRYRDLTYIGIGLLYVIQIIDADVDAHLFNYEVTEDLSMRFDPIILENKTFSTSTSSSSTIGLRCSITF